LFGFSEKSFIPDWETWETEETWEAQGGFAAICHTQPPVVLPK